MIKLTSGYETFQDALYAPAFIPEKFYRIVIRAVQNISSSSVSRIYYDHIEMTVIDHLLAESGVKDCDENSRETIRREYLKASGRTIMFDIKECLSNMNVSYVSYAGKSDIVINSPQGRLM